MTQNPPPPQNPAVPPAPAMPPGGQSPAPTATQAVKPKLYTLAAEEHASTIMIYTQTSLVRGEVVTPLAIRVNTWLRTRAAPEYIHVYNAQVIIQGATGTLQHYAFNEYFVPTIQVLAYHILPPASEPVDYDPTEPNRKLEPATLLVGSFIFNGKIRMATQSNLAKQLENSREIYTSLYDIEVSNPCIPTMGVMRANMALVRTNAVFMASR